MNFFSNIGKKERAWLFIAAGIAAFAFFDRLIIVPITGTFKKINFQIKTNEARIAQALRSISRKDEIEREYQKYIPYIKSSYSEGEEVAKLLESIELMGRDAGVSINDIKPQLPKNIDFYRYYLIEVEAEGTMDALMNFLYKMSSSKQLFRANRIYISLKDKATSAARASILVTKVVAV
ncbi:MAG: type 4a pilus biogenesis protein PilO [Candidatus Omnitrophota bacterium]|nr:type 4a pilus biogenesis protein PilO [Candidatus Omnitrophota bacterium]